MKTTARSHSLYWTRLFAVLGISALGCTPTEHASVASPKASPSASATHLGMALPPAALVNAAGQAATIEGSRAGRPTLITFWATWCQACHEEFDALNRLETAAQKEHALVIGVAVGEPLQDVNTFAAKRGLTYAQLVDEEFVLADALGQRELPATIVLDREGHVVFIGRALDERAIRAFRAAMTQAGP